MKDLWGGVAIHLEVKRLTFSHVGKDLLGKIAVHLRGRNLNSFPLWEGFLGKDSCAIEEESLTSSSCYDRFEGDMTVHLRWKNFKKACLFSTISNRWGRIGLYLGRDYTHLNIQKINYIFKWVSKELMRKFVILGDGQGCSQPYCPGWARDSLSSFFLKFWSIFLIFP